MFIFSLSNSILLRSITTCRLMLDTFFFQKISQVFIKIFCSIIRVKHTNFCLKLIFNHIVNIFEQFFDFGFSLIKYTQHNRVWLSVKVTNHFFPDKVVTFEGHFKFLSSILQKILRQLGEEVVYLLFFPSIKFNVGPNKKLEDAIVLHYFLVVIVVLCRFPFIIIEQIQVLPQPY